jgi:large subunit ribosomal protein L25
MKSVALTAFPRTLNKRTGTKKVRANGRIPAVIYGRHNKPESLELGARDLENVVHGSVSETILVDLSLEKSKRLALLKDIQHHPLSGKMLHVDLHEVVENEKVTINVPVETTGEAVGVKTGGGVLEHVLFKVKVRATPKDLPEVITVDVSNLEVGKSIHIGDIAVPEGVEILGHKENPVVSVAAPLTETQEAASLEAGGAAPTQPEMLKEKKEEGAAAAKGAAPAAGGDKKAAEKKK